MGVKQKVKNEKVGKTYSLDTDSLSKKFNPEKADHWISLFSKIFFLDLESDILTKLTYNFENIHIGLQACFDKKSSVGGALVLGICASAQYLNTS